MTDPTRFDLDDRQRAMLAEMGVRVWWPKAVELSTPAADTAPAGSMPQIGVQALARQGEDAQLAPAASKTSAAEPAMPSTAAPELAAQAAHSRPVPVGPTATPASTAPAVPAAAVAQPLAQGVDRMDWAALQGTVAACQACALCTGRKNTVFGMGHVQADWMVVGEAPDEDEAAQGTPFVGQSGQLLDNMLKAVGLNRQDERGAGVYIANALKCRPALSRNPTPEEVATCAPFLMRQVALVKPKVILAMGRFAVQSLLQSTEPLGKLRGQVHDCQGVPVVVTYHPSYLLRNPADKAKAWADLVLALKVAQG